MSKTALITGITGQDGSYLTELLLGKGYTVHGIIRRSSWFNTDRLHHLMFDENVLDKSLFLHYGDLTDGNNISRLVKTVLPDECYNLGAQSHVKISFDIPEYSANVDGLGTIRLLDSIRIFKPDCKFYQASTSELYGNSREFPQNEKTPFSPRSPYATAKLYAYYITKNYKEAYNLFACNGILFNHESPRRTPNFVTRKITSAVARIKVGKQQKICLGNLTAARDWGFAPEYCEGMWRMLQQDEPNDYVLATGESHTVEEFCLQSFAQAGIPVTFVGEGIDRKAVDSNGIVRVQVDPRYFRRTEVENLIGDSRKAEAKLNWKATTKFYELVKIMTDYDIRNVHE